MPQLKGYLIKSGPSWIGQWREDERSADGSIKRVKKSKAIAPATGKDKVSKQKAQQIFHQEVLSKLDAVTVDEFVKQRFEPDLAYRNKLDHYKTWLKNYVLPALGPRRFQDLTKERIQAVISKAEQTGKSPQTCKHILATIKAVVKHARRTGVWSGADPTEFIELPKMQRKQRSPFNSKKAWPIAQRLKSPYQEFFLTLALSELRSGEALGLVWKYVNVSDETVSVDGQAIPAKCLLVIQMWRAGRYIKKARLEGLVPLNGFLAERLALLKLNSKWAGPDDAVFTVKDGRPFDVSNSCRKKLKPVLKQLGLSSEISWHWGLHAVDSLANLADEVVWSASGPEPAPRRRGRPPIPASRKAAALEAKHNRKSNRQCAQILYAVRKPTDSQVRNVSNVLKRFQDSQKSR